jgi:hypothetical protein
MQYQDWQNPATRKAFTPSRIAYTGGLGYRGQRFYIDMGYVIQQQQDMYYPYTLQRIGSFSPVMLNKTTLHSITSTVGFSW